MSADVQTIDPETNEVAKKERNRKPAFDLSTALDAQGASIQLNEEGALMVIPHNWTSDFSGIKKNEFATEDLYFDWKAARVDVEIAQLQAKQQKFRDEAEECRNPDPKKAGVRKLQRMQANMAKLVAQLTEQGVDLSGAGV